MKGVQKNWHLTIPIILTLQINKYLEINLEECRNRMNNGNVKKNVFTKMRLSKKNFIIFFSIFFLQIVKIGIWV